MSTDRNSLSVRESKVILASQSPERLNLLKQIGINAQVIVSNFDENLSKDMPVEQFVVQTALGKLYHVRDQLINDKTPFDMIIAADTVIHFENKIIGKPIDDQDAKRTINALCGRDHDVYTGVAIMFYDRTIVTFFEKTTVTFRKIAQSTIDSYIGSGGHRGRAGSYGIQRGGAILVDRINGCFSNIVGLPLGRISEHLEKKGFTL